MPMRVLCHDENTVAVQRTANLLRFMAAVSVAASRPRGVLEMKTGSDKVDDQGRAYTGSQLQIQIYVNRRQAELDAAIARALPDTASGIPFDWVSPVERAEFEEYRDLQFLEALELTSQAMDLAEFWPRRGPVWDALARVPLSSGGSTGVLLVEGKSYPAEMRSSGTNASDGSLELIKASLQQTRQWLGAASTPSWTGDLYQLANRLAHLHFFREVARVPAWLVCLNFVGDSHCPTTVEEWESGVQRAKQDLGIAGLEIPFYADVYLPAHERVELLGAHV